MKEILKRLGRRILRRHGIPLNCSPLLPYVDTAALLPANALIRLGTTYGGWIIPVESDLNEDSLCYLVGAGEDISFDCALVQRFGCRVRIIDPTPRAIEHFQELGNAVKANCRFPVNNSTTDFYDITYEQFGRLSFLPVGLASRDVELKFFLPKNPVHVSCSTVNLQQTEDYFTAQCHRLATIMEVQGDSKVDLLKIDIEGAEYMVIQDIVSSGLLPGILLVEFDEAHTPLDNNANSRIGEHIRLLINVGMRCIAVEGCNATFVRQR